ncbi:Tannase/feruloyl esterase [Tricladium varicosporioides]|nr:Tannase/feruloyl esterase [Hymenoscyphus varicosporioides]
MTTPWLEVIVRITILVSLLSQVNAGYEANPWSFRGKCLAFEPSKYLQNATVNALEYVRAGTTLQFPLNDPTCNRANQTVSVDVCRIALNITTSSRSSVISEVWLPGTWSGRFLATGNGGIDGCTKYEDMNYGVKYGFATVGSNNGHNGTSGLAFLHNDEVLQDYVWRALHTITSVGKFLTRAFYTISPTKSYFLGCSGGGRQGIHAAELFPHDYDGIVVGDPAINFNNLYSWRASFLNLTGSVNSTGFIKPEPWRGLVHEEVLKQCDRNDGVVDGVVENPSGCKFDPSTLLCGTSNATECLSAAQVQIVKNVFAPLQNPDGTVAYPAMLPGSELQAAGGLYNGQPWATSLDWFRYVVYSDPNWSNTAFRVVDTAAAQSLNPFNVSTYPTTLSSFSATRGKLLLYHGMADGQITPAVSEAFYQYLSSGMNASTSEMDEFFRFFRISGMNHCNSGIGAWMIGQSSLGDSGAGERGGFEAESNVLAAMVRWVEEGVAPETIEGVKFVDDVRGKGVERRRRHCRYPLVNTYQAGNGNLTESWKCL